MTRPDAALFDIGNVLVHLDFEGPLAELLPAGVSDPDERLQTLLTRKDELESGRLGEDEFISWAADHLGFKGSREGFLDAWNAIFLPNHAMWVVASFLKSLGTRIILFSNTNPMHARWLLANYEIFEEFHGQVFSHEVGSIKPEPEIYHHATQEFELTPESTLYIDDLPENIAKGEELGFRCHQYAFAQHHEFVCWLDNQLGVPSDERN